MAICKRCSKNKFKFYLGKEGTWPVYIDAYKKRWLGNICPDCILGHNQELYNKNYPEIECLYCKKQFKPKTSISKRCQDPKCIRASKTQNEANRRHKLKNSINK